MDFSSVTPASIGRCLRLCALWFAVAALAAPAAQAAPAQLSFSGVVGAPYLPGIPSFVPAVAAGTTVRYEVRFEDRFSDGDLSDWRDPIGPVTGWAEIGTDRYVLNGDRWRFLSGSLTGEQQVSFAFTGTGPLIADGDAFEGLFVSYSTFTGWGADGLLTYRRSRPGGGASYSSLELSGTTVVIPVPLPGTLVLASLGLVLVGWRSGRRPHLRTASSSA